MILCKLQIRQFRRNRRLDLTLAPITTIRGPSGSGKSSLVGAIKWVVFNTPRGMRFIHWGTKHAAVRFILDDGKIIVRKRGKQENYYRLNQRTFKAMGSKVPEEIQNALRLSRLNFHSQHAAHFWFSESAAQVNTQLNAVVDLRIIDRIISFLLRCCRQFQVKIQDTKERIQNLQQRLAQMQYIAQMNTDLQEVEQLYAKAAEIRANTVELGEKIRGVSEYRFRRDRLRQWAREARITQQEIEQALKIRAETEKLGDLLRQIEQHRETIRKSQETQRQLQRQFTALLGKECPLCGTVLSTSC